MSPCFWLKTAVASPEKPKLTPAPTPIAAPVKPESFLEAEKLKPGTVTLALKPSPPAKSHTDPLNKPILVLILPTPTSTPATFAVTNMPLSLSAPSKNGNDSAIPIANPVTGTSRSPNCWPISETKAGTRAVPWKVNVNNPKGSTKLIGLLLT